MSFEYYYLPQRQPHPETHAARLSVLLEQLSDLDNQQRFLITAKNEIEQQEALLKVARERLNYFIAREQNLVVSEYQRQHEVNRRRVQLQRLLDRYSDLETDYDFNSSDSRPVSISLSRSDNSKNIKNPYSNSYSNSNSNSNISVSEPSENSVDDLLFKLGLLHKKSSNNNFFTCSNNKNSPYVEHPDDGKESETEVDRFLNLILGPTIKSIPSPNKRGSKRGSNFQQQIESYSQSSDLPQVSESFEEEEEEEENNRYNDKLNKLNSQSNDNLSSPYIVIEPEESQDNINSTSKSSQDNSQNLKSLDNIPGTQIPVSWLGNLLTQLSNVQNETDDANDDTNNQIPLASQQNQEDTEMTDDTQELENNAQNKYLDQNAKKDEEEANLEAAKIAQESNDVQFNEDKKIKNLNKNSQSPKTDPIEVLKKFFPNIEIITPENDSSSSLNEKPNQESEDIEMEIPQSEKEPEKEKIENKVEESQSKPKLQQDDLENEKTSNSESYSNSENIKKIPLPWLRDLLASTYQDPAAYYNGGNQSKESDPFASTQIPFGYSGYPFTFIPTTNNSKNSSTSKSGSSPSNQSSKQTENFVKPKAPVLTPKEKIEKIKTNVNKELNKIDPKAGQKELQKIRFNLESLYSQLDDIQLEHTDETRDIRQFKHDVTTLAVNGADKIDKILATDADSDVESSAPKSLKVETPNIERSTSPASIRHVEIENVPDEEV